MVKCDIHSILKCDIHGMKYKFTIVFQLMPYIELWAG